MCDYEVVVESHIDKKRFKEFVTLDVEHLTDGCTRILVKMADQAELFSLLNRIRDMNLNLVLLRQCKERKER